jgi:chaperonin GroES
MAPDGTVALVPDEPTPAPPADDGGSTDTSDPTAGVGAAGAGGGDGAAASTGGTGTDGSTTGETAPSTSTRGGAARSAGPTGPDDKLPIKMLNDRILVRIGGSEGERRSRGGILIPATVQMGRRLTWAEVVAVGPNVRAMEPGDQVLFNPEDRYEVEVRGEDFIILRERDIHAVAAGRLEEGSTGLYL